MASVNDAKRDLYLEEVANSDDAGRRMTAVSEKWSSSGVGLTAAESEARRLEKKGTFAASMDDEAGTVTLSQNDFKKVMGKLGGESHFATTATQAAVTEAKHRDLVST